MVNIPDLQFPRVVLRVSYPLNFKFHSISAAAFQKGTEDEFSDFTEAYFV
jgi:hypothetical protein